MEQKLKNIAGVSLIEITVGMLLVAIALFTIVSVFPKMGAHGKNIGEAEQARMIAVEVLEGMQSIAATTIAGVSCATNALVSDDDYVTFKAGYTPRTISGVTYTVDFPKEASCGAIKTIEVKVTWTKSNKDHNISVTGAVK